MTTSYVPAIGDVVMLGSTGPHMTIEGIENTGTAPRIRCVWFVEGQLYRDEFIQGSLIQVLPR